MRTIWKGALTFGLVNVPVKVYSATEDHDVPLHQVHEKDGGRIRYQRTCEVCGETVAYADIDRAYVDEGQTVVLTKDDLAALPAEKSREIDVVEFVPSDQVDLLTLDKPYYLEPDSKSPKAYVLLRKTLEQTDRTAIVRFTLRQKTRLAALRVRGKVLVLQTLLWADEVREAAFPALDEDVPCRGGSRRGRNLRTGGTGAGAGGNRLSGVHPRGDGGRRGAAGGHRPGGQQRSGGAGRRYEGLARGRLRDRELRRAAQASVPSHWCRTART